MESADSRSPLLQLAKSLRPNTLIKALSGAAIIWFTLEADSSHAVSIHRAFVRDTWHNSKFAERLVLILGFALAVPITPVVSAVLTRRCGPRVRAATGKSLLHQFLEQLALAAGKAVPPPWYYVFELYEADHRARVLEYLYRFETKAALYDTLRRRLSDPATGEALSDKAAFSARCLKHGLPAVRALATVRKGRVEWLGGQGLPHDDLFLKPVRGAGGRGASRWTFQADGLYHGNQGTVFDEAGLMRYLAELSQTQDYLVRARVHNHPQLADLAGDVLTTVRVVSCLDERGRPEVTHAVMRMASSNKVVVDNFHAGGVAATVDLDTGKLGPASDMGLSADSRWWDRHPLSNARITGRAVPAWNQVLDLARRAHEIFPDQVAIGWDIAVSDDGPILIEGNKSPDLDIIQRISREPLGNSRLGELLCFHIRRAMADDTVREQQRDGGTDSSESNQCRIKQEKSG